MNRQKQIKALLPLVAMMRDLALADVSRAARDHQSSLDHYAALDPKPAQGVGSLAEARAYVLYQLWAEQRRTALEPVIQRQRQMLAKARQSAGQAVGRADVLRRLWDGKT